MRNVTGVGLGIPEQNTISLAFLLAKVNRNSLKSRERFVRQGMGIEKASRWRDSQVGSSGRVDDQFPK